MQQRLSVKTIAQVDTRRGTTVSVKWDLSVTTFSLVISDPYWFGIKLMGMINSHWFALGLTKNKLASNSLL